MEFPSDDYALNMLTQAAQGLQQRIKQVQQIRGISNHSQGGTSTDHFMGSSRTDSQTQGHDNDHFGRAPQVSPPFSPYVTGGDGVGVTMRGGGAQGQSTNRQRQRNHENGHGSYDPSAISTRSVEFVAHPVPDQGLHGRGLDAHMGYVLSSDTNGSERNGFHNVPFVGIAAQNYGQYQMSSNGHGNHDLGILNAETFDDGEGDSRAQTDLQQRLTMLNQREHRPSVWGYVTEEAPSSGVATQKENTPVAVSSRDQHEVTSAVDSQPKRGRKKASVVDVPRVENGEGEDVPAPEKRKKRKLKAMTSPSPEEEDDAGKKSRGRPRVNPKDETAAERRRTQIRLAQRAYRNRKETTISSLEQTVQEMKDSSREVNTLFLKMYELASSHGILGRQPDLAKRLAVATKKIRSAEGVPFDDSDETPPESHLKSEVTSVPLIDRDASQISPPMSEYGHSHGSNSQSMEDHVDDILQRGDTDLQPSSTNVQIMSHLPENITNFSVDVFGPQQFKSGMSQYRHFSQTLNLQPNPSSPASMAYLEVSFSRRLQRQTTEAALRLASMPHPPPAKWSRVFGITSQFETRPQIVARLQRVLQATKDTTLEQWNQPFVHFGGSGTHYPMREKDISTMPKLRTGYGMGPFTQPVAEFKDKLLEDSLTLDNLQYHKDTYFDSNDIECYLETLGISVKPSQDFVNAILDLARLQNYTADSSATQSMIRASSTIPSRTTRSSSTNDSNNMDHIFSNLNMGYGRAVVGGDSSLASMGPDISPQSITSNGSSPHHTDSGQNLMPDLHGFGTVNIVFDTRSMVTIDVSKFVTELVSSCTCLGRAPGYKPSHVNQALLAAISMG